MAEINPDKGAQIALELGGKPLRFLVINEHKLDRGWTYSIGMASGPEPRQSFYLQPRLGWFERDRSGALFSMTNDKATLFQIERGKTIPEAMGKIRQYLQGSLVFCYEPDEIREIFSRICEAHRDEPDITPALVPDLEMISFADCIDQLEREIKFSKRQTPEEAVDKATHRNMRAEHAGDEAAAHRNMIAKMLKARRIKPKPGS